MVAASDTRLADVVIGNDNDDAVVDVVGKRTTSNSDGIFLLSFSLDDTATCMAVSAGSSSGCGG